jgi:hypothetical protein
LTQPIYYSARNLHEPVRALLVHGWMCAVIGRDVYSSNLQLGGPKIMHTNGVAHQVVNNDYDGTSCIHTHPYVEVVPQALPHCFRRCRLRSHFICFARLLCAHRCK